MPKADGEYILSRVSKIATAGGRAAGTAQCKGNFFIVVTSDPDGVIKAWIKRDVRIFGEETDQRGTHDPRILSLQPGARLAQHRFLSWMAHPLATGRPR